jgi:hypothetical protein
MKKLIFLKWIVGSLLFAGPVGAVTAVHEAYIALVSGTVIIGSITPGVIFTVTFNGGPQPVTVENPLNVTVQGSVTVIQGTDPWIVDAATGSLWTITTNGAALPITIDGIATGLIFTVTFNGGPQPVTIENIVDVWTPATGVTVFGDSYMRGNVNAAGLMTLISATAFLAEETATGEAGIAAHVKDVSSINVYRLATTLTLFTTQYTAGDALGGIIPVPFTTLENGASGIIQAVKIADADGEESPIDVTFWGGAYTPTGNSVPFDPPDAQQENSLGVVNITAGNYATWLDSSLATRAGLGMPFDLTSTIFSAQCVIREDTTYTASTDIDVIIEILRK